MSLPPLLEKSSKSFGLAWALFAATATFSAFFLPVFIWAFLNEYVIKENVFGFFFLFLVLPSGLYHSLYRVKTVAFDLGFGKFQKITNIVVGIIFLFALAILVYAFLIVFPSIAGHGYL